MVAPTNSGVKSVSPHSVFLYMPAKNKSSGSGMARHLVEETVSHWWNFGALEETNLRGVVERSDYHFQVVLGIMITRPPSGC